ncbi:hypothetical protein [Ruminiclostridium cellobioparum]|uniref:Uncharacterized protein n=1 Tax=Ruminiclostridium cellobioparum subsp. termitidis CT1112 TaxID=1195236 RepID=S0FFW9_RUMCE|nr:hypothetical protein [Ruminiclostridium cellobioparum]EMS70040.1 hypothetical protein CTER_4187 [Ruminiclostridium cellobioparum subsp. termitidis CT1112]
MLSSENYKLSDKEIIEKGSRALIKELGYSGFLRYIRNFEEGHGEDYLNVQNDIYKDMSLDEIFEKLSPITIIKQY